MEGKEKGKPGRKKILFTEEDYENITRWAGLGLSEQQIADNLGVSLSSIARNKRNNDKFDTALKKGKSKSIEVITNALFEKAKNKDTTSMIFWLKNRAPNEWNDNVQVNHKIDIKKMLTDAHERIIEGETVDIGRISDDFPKKKLTGNDNKE
jgi:IS30 family transposase